MMFSIEALTSLSLAIRFDVQDPILTLKCIGIRDQQDSVDLTPLKRCSKSAGAILLFDGGQLLCRIRQT